MPIVHVHTRAGRPADTKRAILDAIHGALVEAFRIPPHDRHQLLHEHAPEHLDSTKGADFTLVEVSAFPGRSREAKNRLYAQIVKNLACAAGIDPAAVMIVLHEPPLESGGDSRRSGCIGRRARLQARRVTSGHEHRVHTDSTSGLKPGMARSFAMRHAEPRDYAPLIAVVDEWAATGANGTKS